MGKSENQTFFPVLKVNGYEGKTTLHNFSPVASRSIDPCTRYVNATWSDGELWRTQHLQDLAWGNSLSIFERELQSLPTGNSSIWLSLSKHKIPGVTLTLPKFISVPSVLPSWRASVSLCTRSAEANYQGEIFPFPNPSALLSFGVLSQRAAASINLLIVLNLEKSPTFREAPLEFFSSLDLRKLGEHTIVSNSVNVIDLKRFQIPEEEIMVVACKTMAGIPLYFSNCQYSGAISLEHTHPPASFACFGDRFNVQRSLKTRWLGMLEK